MKPLASSRRTLLLWALGLALLAGAEAVRFLGSAGCSTTVFQLPQAGHFPTHVGVSFPHSVQ